VLFTMQEDEQKGGSAKKKGKATPAGKKGK
jgi:hypothetical protein